MKKKKRNIIIIGGLITTGFGFFLWNKSKEKDQPQTEEEIANSAELVVYKGNYFPVANINKQSTDLNLTAQQAQKALSENTKEGQIVELSLMQLMKQNSIQSS